MDESHIHHTIHFVEDEHAKVAHIEHFALDQVFDTAWCTDDKVSLTTKARDLTVYRRSADGCFPKSAQLSAGDDAFLTTPVLPGFTLSLAKLLA